MNNVAWRDSILSAVRRKARPLPAAFSSDQSSSALETHALSARSCEMRTGDIPVFDCHRRQVGFIARPVERPEVQGELGHRLMSHCMNTAVSWLALEVPADNIDRLARATCLRRIPLTDPDNQLCGIMVLDAG